VKSANQNLLTHLDSKLAPAISLPYTNSNLELEMVAEGAEYVEQLRILAEFNGAVIQGDYYSEPVAASIVTDWLTY
jgi:sensor c-di-GMP phosphodiesterase-like protein